MSVNQVSPPQLKLMKPPEKLEKEKEKLQILRVFPGESLQIPCSTFRTYRCMLKEKQAEQEVKPQTETPFMQEPKLTKDLKLFDRWDSSLFFWQYYRADKHQGCFSTSGACVCSSAETKTPRDDWNYDISICSIDAHSCSQKKIRVKKKEIWALDWSSCKTDFVDCLSFTNMSGAHVKVRREWTRMEKRDFLESWASISFSSLSAA